MKLFVFGKTVASVLAMVLHRGSATGPDEGTGACFTGGSCTAKDVQFLGVDVVSAASCVEGEPYDLVADFNIVSTADTKYEVGVWIGLDGADAGRPSGDCYIGTLPADSSSSGDTDMCGDVEKGFPYTRRIETTVICDLDPTTGKLALPYCLTWYPANNQGCDGIGELRSGTGSKCRCLIEVLDVTVITDPCEGIVCDDNDLCTTDSCVEGSCVYNSIDCDDGQSCTVDTCDTATGSCVNTVSCDDGDLCTTDSCGADGSCMNEPINCDDGNLCTTDTCVAGTCVNTAVDCDDGQSCTVDTCDTATGSCVNTVSCDDDDLCTTDSCGADGSCMNEPINCDDGNLCTTDTCVAGTCVNTAVDCDDGKSCTVDTCDTATGSCVNTVSCDDGDLCTNDSCGADGSCMNDPIDCNDHLLCTTDTCNPHTGECQYDPDDSKCDNDVFCDGEETCVVGSGCEDGTPPCPVDDGDFCNGLEECDELSQTCEVDNPEPCNDGIDCTVDTCTSTSHGAVCDNTPNDGLCNDGVDCTFDYCGATGCIYDGRSYTLKCGKTLFLCGLSESDLNVNGNVYSVGSCGVGTVSEFITLPLPSCLDADIEAICPENGKGKQQELSNYVLGNCVNDSTGDVCCSKVEVVDEYPHFPVDPYWPPQCAHRMLRAV